MIRFVVFDFDGTIADSRRLAFHVYNEHAKAFDFRQIKTEDVPMLREMSTTQRIRFMGAAIWKLPKILFSALRSYQNRIEEIDGYAGIDSLLRDLNEKGYRMMILSSNTEENIQGFLQRQGWEMFEEIHHASFLKGKAQRLKQFLDEKQIPETQVLYVGDEVRDIEACRKNGISICAVSWGFDSAEVLTEHQPNWLVHQVDELQKVIEDWHAGGV